MVQPTLFIAESSTERCLRYQTEPDLVRDQDHGPLRFSEGQKKPFRCCRDGKITQHDIREPERQAINKNYGIGPRDGAHYVCGVDVATEKDFTVAVVLDAVTGDMVYMDRFNRVTFPELEDRLHALYQRWNIQTMVIEVNSIGRGVIDHLRQRNMTIVEFQTTNTTKTAIIQGLQTALEHRELRLLADAVLIAELQAYEGERLANGWRYGAPSPLHDDCVMAFAFANDARGGNAVMTENPFY